MHMPDHICSTPGLKAIIVNLFPRCKLYWAALTKNLRPAKGQYQLVLVSCGELTAFSVMAYGLVNESVMCGKESDSSFL